MEQARASRYNGCKLAGEMSWKEFFKPTWKKVLIGIIIFIFASSISFLASIGGISSFQLSPLLFRLFLTVGLSLIFAYSLSCFLVVNFSIDYLRNSSIMLKFVLTFLLFTLIWTPIKMFILNSTIEGLFSSYFNVYTFIPEVIIYIILISIIFLSIKVSFSWFFGSLYFLYYLFDPFNGNLNRGSGIFLLLFKQNVNILSFIPSVILFGLIILYLFIFLRRSNEESSFVKIIFSICLLAWIIPVVISLVKPDSILIKMHLYWILNLISNILFAIMLFFIIWIFRKNKLKK